MLINPFHTSRYERMLWFGAYFVTGIWLLGLLLPFGWMVCSGMKNRYTVYNVAEWRPPIPWSTRIHLSYPDKKTAEQAGAADAATAAWMLWEDLEKDNLREVVVIGTVGNRAVFHCSIPSQELSQRKKRRVLAAVMSPEIIRPNADSLTENLIEFKDGPPLSPRKDKNAELTAKAENILAGQNLAGTVAEISTRSRLRLFLAPFAESWHYAFQSTTEITSLGRFLLNSLIVSSSVVVVQLLISASAAYALAFLVSRRTGKWIMTFFLATMMVPPLLLFIPLFQMMRFFPLREIPLLGTELPTVNLLDPNLISLLGVQWGQKVEVIARFLPLVLPYLAWALPILVLRGFFGTLPIDLIEAGRLDGAPERLLMTRVVMPLSKAMITVMALMTFLAVWPDFLWPYVVSVAQPRPSWTFPVALYTLSEGLADINLVMAA
ncbi:MAG: carbohydrate ABC transporter permease, partial [bacterium]